MPSQQEISEIVTDLVSPAQDIREAAFARVRGLRGEAKAAVPALVRALEDTDLDEEIRCIAASCLIFIGNEAENAIPVLGRILLDSDVASSLRERCACALRGIGRAAVPMLLRALANGDVEGRKAAAGELQNVKPQPPEAIPALIEALKDEDIGYIASSSLRDFGPAAVPLLTEALSEKDATVRAYIAKTLLQIDSGNTRAIATAIACLRDPTAEARERAASALYSEAGSHSQLGVEDYVELLQDDVDRVRAFAALAHAEHRTDGD